MNIPQPYGQDDVEHRFWSDEPFDDVVPPGFLSDLVLATRGLETPTAFCLWAGLWLISSAIKRGASIITTPLAPPMYPNLYVSLVGPPRVVGKSTIIAIAARILRDSNQFIGDPQTRADRRPNIILSRTTAVSLLSDRLIIPDGHPLRAPVRLADGRIYTPPASAQGSIVASELITLIGKQQYLEDLVGNLTDLYDCKDRDELSTKARGVEVLENVYITLIGATTPKALHESFPPTAYGDGFLSRVVPVFVERPTRIYPDPMMPDPAPDGAELSARLAWCTENATGAFTFDDKAARRWRQVYRDRRVDLINNLHDPDRSIDFRFDIHFKTLAVLIRASRYRPGTNITIEDLDAAEAILDRTFERTRESMRGVGAIGPWKSRNTVISYLRNHPEGLDRRRLSQYVSREMPVRDLDVILRELVMEGSMAVHVNGSTKKVISRSGAEVYKWIS